MKKILVSFCVLMISNFAFAVNALKVESMPKVDIAFLGSYLLFQSSSQDTSLFGGVVDVSAPIVRDFGYRLSFTQSYTNDGLLESIYTKLDGGVDYFILGSNTKSSVLKKNFVPFAKVDYKKERKLSVGSGLGVGSFNLFDSSLVLNGIYLNSTYVEPVTDNFSVVGMVKYDFMSSRNETLQIVNVSLGFDYEISF